MNKFIILILALWQLNSMEIISASEGCIYDERPSSHHILEAIHLNKKRHELYQENFGNKVAKTFGLVMIYEHLMLPFTYRLDLKAKKYLCAGIPILKNDLVDMNLTPEFSTRPIAILDYEKPVEKSEVKLTKKYFKQAIKSDLDSADVHFTKSVSFLRQKIAALSKAPHVNCLYRHFLESMLLALSQAHQYATQSYQLGLKSSQSLSAEFAKSHLTALGMMASLDRKAFPWQRQGIPVFCQDIPQISF